MMPLEIGTLREQLRSATARALAGGSLRPIATELEVIEDQGLRFPVRIVASLGEKPQALDLAPARNLNPFLPYDPQLFVADISTTHVGLLNKFPVVDEHLLIVTREFEHQQSRLNDRDFTALARCLAEYDALGFYNSGKVAGASQPHKHLQAVPLVEPPRPGSHSGGASIPPSPSATLPLPPLIDAIAGGGVQRCPRLPFAHAAARLDAAGAGDTARFGCELAAAYAELLGAVGIDLPRDEDTRIARPYNLLVTRSWMLVVPRRQECFEGISLNAIAFVGGLFVRDQEQLDRLRHHGPLAALTAAAGET